MAMTSHPYLCLSKSFSSFALFSEPVPWEKKSAKCYMVRPHHQVKRKGKEKKRVWYSFLHHTTPPESRTSVHCSSAEHRGSPRSPRNSLAQRPATRHSLQKLPLKQANIQGRREKLGISSNIHSTEIHGASLKGTFRYRPDRPPTLHSLPPWVFGREFTESRG